jgi:hypothetical protein
MARGKRPRSGEVRAGVPALTLEEARQRLHELASQFGELSEPSGSLLDRAQSVGAYRRGGLLLVPEIDALAAVARLEETEQEIEELLDELEDVGREPRRLCPRRDTYRPRRGPQTQASALTVHSRTPLRLTGAAGRKRSRSA